MTIDQRQPFGPIDESALRAFESRLPGPLPSDLRDFLVQFNGARISDSVDLEQLPCGTMLEKVFGLHDGPGYLRLDEMYNELRTWIPDTLLVFGDDGCGNYFGVSLASTDYGTVYFVDHERLPVDRSSLHRVAASFADLMRQAGDDVREQPAIESLSEAIGLPSTVNFVTVCNFLTL